MMDRDERAQMLAEMGQFRAERNAAQQRAEQAERERDEARAVIAMIHAMLREHPLTSNPVYTVNPNAQPAWTPQTGAEIAAAIGDKPILPADFDIDRAPTVKADDDLDPASRYLEYAITDMNDDNTMDAVMHLSDAVGHIIDALKEMQKGGAK